MELVNGKVIFEDALKNRYGVGAFNFVNLEVLKAILDAAEEMKRMQKLEEARKEMYGETKEKPMKQNMFKVV